jgi:ethanolamine utilization protein EutN
MLHGLVIGQATSTIKHPSMDGWKLAIIQPLGASGTPDGDPQIAVDPLGAGVGQHVIINSDGRFARETVGHDKSPVRYVLCGIVDRK